MRRVGWCVAVMAAMIVMSGCGVDHGATVPAPSQAGPSGSAVSSAAPSAASPANAAALPLLSYRAIASTLRASVPLDGGNAAPARRTFRRVCQQLDQRDPVLRAFRGWCTGAAALYDSQAAEVACGASHFPASANLLTMSDRIVRCEGQVDGVNARAWDHFAAAYTELDRVVDKYVRTASCRAVLSSRVSELKYARSVASAWHMLEIATRSKSIKGSETAQERLQYANDHYLVRTNQAQLDEFQQHCR
jgi:hypothetical protein